MSERDPMIGRVVLGRYRIVRALAKGGMGVVYLARTEGASGFSKPFVVKRMATDILVDQNMLKMFVREARVMSRLRHPGLVGVTDFGEESGDYLMVLEYVHGFHLGQWHRFHRQSHGPFPIELVLHIMCKVLDGLDYAHTLAGPAGNALEIVHRDVSPSNILIDVEGIVKLADFGVARSEEHTEKTEETTIKGKMPYLAPELFRLAKPTPATDGYAAAVVLHELIVGRNEFRTGDMASTVSRVLEHQPSNIDQVRRDSPKGLSAVLRRALHKDPDKRYQTAAELAGALRGVRTAPEEDADKTLRELARRDFLNPSMGELLGIVSLAERDDAWRNAPMDDSAAEADSLAPPTVASINLGKTGIGTTGTPTLDIEHALPPTEVGRTRMWQVVAGLFTAGVAAGAIVLAVANLFPPQPPVVVEVGRTTEPQGETDAAVADSRTKDTQGVPALDAATATRSTPEKDAGPSQVNTKKAADPRVHNKRTLNPSSPQALSQVVGRRRGDVIACFQGARDRIDMSIRLSIDTSGQVVRASLSGTGANANVAQTASGRCVLGVARSTKFPRQPKPLTFTIPFTIQAR